MDAVEAIGKVFEAVVDLDIDGVAPQVQAALRAGRFPLAAVPSPPAPPPSNRRQR